MDAVWPDTFPTGDVLTQAITQLRKAFADDPDAPRHVETIAKAGYRLIAEVEWLPARSAVAPRAPEATPAEPLSPVVPPPAAREARRTGLPRVALLVAILAASVLLVVLLWGARRVATPAAATQPDPPSVTRLTSTPGIERQPRLSPDGKIVAFVAPHPDDAARSVIQLQPLDGFASRPLTRPETGRDDHPAWAPDGQRLALRRCALREGCRIVLVTLASGEERELAPTSPTLQGLDWSPDGSWLAAGGYRLEGTDGGGSLQRLDLDSGTWQALEYPRAPSDWDSLPKFSADGGTLLFRRGTSTADLWTLNLATHAAAPLTSLSADLRGHDWLPDGRVVFAQVDAGGLRLLALTPGAGATDLALNGATFPDVAAGHDTLVFQLPDLDGRLWRRVLERDRLGEAQLELASSGANSAPAIAPDGRHVAFYSTRSGSTLLWVAARGASRPPTAFAGFEPHPRFPPAWHPSGERLLAIGSSSAGRGLHEATLATGRVRWLALAQREPVFASYLTDGRILAAIRDGTRQRLALFEPEQGGMLLESELEASFALEDAARERIIFASPHAAGLYAADRGLGTSQLLLEGFVHPPNYRAWSVAGDALWLLGATPGEAELWRLDLRPAASRPISLGTVPGSYLRSLSVEADGRAAWFSDESSAGIDIGFARIDPATAPD